VKYCGNKTKSVSDRQVPCLPRKIPELKARVVCKVKVRVFYYSG